MKTKTQENKSLCGTDVTQSYRKMDNDIKDE